MKLSEDQIHRYSRQIILPGIGGKGQRKLAEAKVFIMGAGGLGSPAALYLAAARVGTIGLADSDLVELSNLQRQILHRTCDVGFPKVESGEKTLEAVNPEVKVNIYPERVTSANALEMIKDYDLVLDGSDNFPTRFLVNDACYFEKKTLISGAILCFEGQLSTFKSHANGPCYRCLALDLSFTEMKIQKNPMCPLCGENPTVKELIQYSQSCSTQDSMPRQTSVRTLV